VCTAVGQRSVVSRGPTVRLGPVEFLTDEQAEAYGTVSEVATCPELERSGPGGDLLPVDRFTLTRFRRA